MRERGTRRPINEGDRETRIKNRKEPRPQPQQSLDRTEVKQAPDDAVAQHNLAPGKQLKIHIRVNCSHE